jgi:hypothetical protein
MDVTPIISVVLMKQKMMAQKINQVRYREKLP